MRITLILATSLVFALAATAEIYEVRTAEEFNRRAAELRPGDELVVANGVHADWPMELKGGGSKEKPVVVRPEKPGGVLFRRKSSMTISADHVVVRGFEFEHCYRPTIHIFKADHNRVTRCRFLWCGNPRWTFGRTVDVGWESSSNRIDHCYFEGSKSISTGQKVAAKQENTGTHNRWDHNTFRDIIRLYGNGQEAIQLGPGGTSSSSAYATVEYNTFDNAGADGEVISNKSSGNTIRYNVLAYCKGRLVMRGGRDCLVEGNVSVRSRGGIRVHDSGHTVINNLIVAPERTGIGVSGGTANYGAPRDCLIAHNTIINAGKEAISITCDADSAKGTRIVNNLLVADGENPRVRQNSVLVHATAALGDRVMNNLLWATGKARVGFEGKAAILADPLLGGADQAWAPSAGGPAVDRAVPLPGLDRDRFGCARPKGRGPDIGASEFDPAGMRAPQIELPEIPPQRAPFDANKLKGRPLIELRAADWAAASTTAQTGKLAPSGQILHLTDTELWLNRPLPADFVAEWEYRPAALESRARVTFAAAGREGGYTLDWGGARQDSKRGARCDGVIALAKAGDLIAEGHDVVMRYCAKETPKPGAWYRCRLIKHGELLRLEMFDTRAVDWQAKDTVTPILIWRDRGHVGGPRLGAGAFGIRQRGSGAWRNLTVWACN